MKLIPLYNWGIGFHGASKVNGIIILYNNSNSEKQFSMTSTVYSANCRIFETIEMKRYILVGDPDEQLKKQYYQSIQEHIYLDNPFIHAIQHNLVLYDESLTDNEISRIEEIDVVAESGPNSDDNDSITESEKDSSEIDE